MSSDELQTILDNVTENTKTISNVTVIQDLNQCIDYEERLNIEVDNRLDLAEEHIGELERCLDEMNTTYSQLKDEYHSRTDINDHVREEREQIMKDYHEQEASNMELLQRLEGIDEASKQLELASMNHETSTELLQLSLFRKMGIHMVVKEEINDIELGVILGVFVY
ncbi:hypothetical protein BDB01DRAFT_895199 [Pilobolus umbonatus]|nr:hypothetical protein BDB01DRAFT_895199 [Pilobolus umbonatus]